MILLAEPRVSGGPEPWGEPSQTREEVGLSCLATENPEVF